MKRVLSILLTLAVMMCVLSACSEGESVMSENSENSGAVSKQLKIVTTIFPEYDWVVQLLGDKAADADVTMLLDNGVDLHSYQPTAEDIMKISTCDIFIYVGGESDEWVEDALKEASNKDMVVINLLDVLGDSVKSEQIKEGMESDHDHDHSKEVSTFNNEDVQDRNLSDWEGKWNSPYPFVLDGTLDDAFEVMAEEKGKMTAAEYKEYYKKGYETDISSLTIDGDTIKFEYDDGHSVSSEYKYTGYYIQDWSSGTSAAMYRFEAVDKNSGAPVYIEINDHMIESAKAEHFHLRMSNESYDAIPDPESKWPTFFPAEMSGEEICEHLAGHDNHKEEEKDEHVWLSLKNTAVICEAVADSLAQIDPENADAYKDNLETYKTKLSDLDKRYESVAAESKTKTLLFGDRFPFRYLTDDYGLDYYAAFVGCSAETEASFETIRFLSEKVDELDLKYVLTIENSDKRIAQTIIDNTVSKDQRIIALDSMQSTTMKSVQSGTTYLSIMESNLNALKTALS